MSESELPSAPAAPAVHRLQCEVCVVGGGMAGLCAAIASARQGADTVLVQDRAVLGGNASSEIRMWICGAHGADNKETGILEELQLENIYRNPGLKYALWDSVLYDKAAYQPKLRLSLCSAVHAVTMEGPRRIASIRAWHLTRQCFLEIGATQFIDCSGDSILRFSGASHRWGREANSEFGESHAPATADRKTMGNSLLMQLRSIDPQHHLPFRPPAWAEVFAPDHPRVQSAKPVGDNFWWMEIGGEGDTMLDADAIRDDLLRIAYGVWTFIKNHPDGRGHSWELEWIGMLPGKRENVRYEGDHMLCQGEIEACGIFPDLIGHGGWSMDDHHPAAFRHPGAATVFHPAPSPYGIPWRCLYSRSVDNLLFAGRNSSCSHLAMSSTRVMGTCAVMGQAAGTGAALAVRHRTSARGVLSSHLWELQNQLMDDDHWLPNRRRRIPDLTVEAELTTTHGPAESLRRGLDRRSAAHQAWSGPAGSSITFRWHQPRQLQRLRIICDSQLHRSKRMPCTLPEPGHAEAMPGALLRDAEVQVWDEIELGFRTVAHITENRQRRVMIPLPYQASRLRLVVGRSWDGDLTRLFSCEVGLPDMTAAHEILAWPVPAISGHGVA